MANYPEWQPINSAPKDGTEILLFCSQRKICYGHCEEAKFTEVGTYVSYSDGSGSWEGVDTSGGEYGNTLVPTHWMPLPPPPSEDKSR
jgi:hypothetical protein